MWQGVDRSDIRGSWRAQLGGLLTLLAAAQQAAAEEADPYLEAVLAEQEIEAEAEGAIRPDEFAGLASDGRPLESLLEQPVVATLTAIQAGATVARAMATGQGTLEMILGTQVADAGRTADGAALTARPPTGGYVRMLVGKSCSRCAVLAGKWFRWNAGFRRHPRCDCVHVPSSEDRAGDVRTDPRAYFDSLSRADQDKVFTKAGAQAIRDGADIGQVVNARRGMSLAGKRITAEERRALVGGDRARLQTTRVFGRDAYITSEGTTVRGQAGKRLGNAAKDGGRYRRSQTPRLMPEQIYRDAESREDAIRLLRRFGYIT